MTLLKEFETAFEKLKSELKFKSSLEDFDRIFFFRDFISREKFVSTSLSRALSGRIVELYMSWNGYLHGLVLPNPAYMPSVTENQMFSDEEKDNMLTLMKKIMALSSTHSVVGVTKDKKLEAQYFDDAVHFWDKTLQPELAKILKKVNAQWAEQAKGKKKGSSGEQ